MNWNGEHDAKDFCGASAYVEIASKSEPAQNDASLQFVFIFLNSLHVLMSQKTSLDQVDTSPCDTLVAREAHHSNTSWGFLQQVGNMLRSTVR
ncbi:hypothetical protein PR003_g12550 [Phytophthora rubi]|uniref:Uncharacterized protein n=1 Tax=Phytophthora rubi TaxID=129364 RepID=A0A6A3MFS3_9STRA|nr:hypothetical protein PR002_g12183 [Phytophthora rubi]KAE9028355.1 hypothetical protein PR001_g11759 [Phytophthora rubi]KAE9336369.1 hypothetical protein PR003_g12550 [Phytophthora rubi]